jgi:UDP-N-acetylglucosamine 4,6-dehydratase
MFNNKIILITGGTGSFGNAVLKYLLHFSFSEIRILSRDEKKQDDMRIRFNDFRIKFYIGDVRDISSLNYAMADVNYVFHAAALKQVPSCEFFPLEATKTNIIGTYNVICSAKAHNVEKMVCLSTDKAAYPINAMGISKALMEKVVISEARSMGSNGPILCITRYGNVMASRGSVIPLFIKQIKENRALTVTDPNMTRFMMSLDEAVDLVSFAFEHGNQGDLFVPKVPASTIGDVALALKKIFNAQNEINIIGPRHSEKLYETLLTKEEFYKAEDLGLMYRVLADNRDLNYNRCLNQEEISYVSNNEYHSHNTTRLNLQQTIDKIIALKYVKEIRDIHNNLN